MPEKPAQLSWIAVDIKTGEVITGNEVKRAVVQHREIFAKLAEVCRMLPTLDEDGKPQWHLMTKSERGQLNRYAKELHDAGASIEALSEFERWWYQNDWRGSEKRQPPAPAYVAQLWTRSRNQGARESVGQSWKNYLDSIGYGRNR